MVVRLSEVVRESCKGERDKRQETERQRDRETERDEQKTDSK